MLCSVPCWASACCCSGAVSPAPGGSLVARLVVLGFGSRQGPVAVVLTGLTLLIFAVLRRDLVTPWQRPLQDC